MEPRRPDRGRRLVPASASPSHRPLAIVRRVFLYDADVTGEKGPNDALPESEWRSPTAEDRARFTERLARVRAEAERVLNEEHALLNEEVLLRSDADRSRSK